MGTTDASPASGAPVSRQRPRRTHGHGVSESPHIRLTTTVAQPGSPDAGPREPRAHHNDRGPHNRGPQKDRCALDKRYAISERDLGSQAGAGAGRRVERERPVEGRYAVGQAAEPGALRDVRATDTVV
jgi:hypothetical protein